MLAWTQVVDPARRGRLTVARRVAFAAGMLIAGWALAELLIALHPLYPHYLHVHARPFGWSAARDQRAAAVAMMAEQTAAMMTALAFLIRPRVEHVAPEIPVG